MRIVNEKLEPLYSYDLEKGHLVDIILIKEDAVPIDNITKFAWDEDDYEPAKMFLLNKSSGESLNYQEEIKTLKGENEALKSQVGALRKTILNSI